MSLNLASRSSFKGSKSYKCRLCGFMTTDRTLMERHLKAGGTGHNVKTAFSIPDEDHEDEPSAEKAKRDKESSHE